MALNVNQMTSIARRYERFAATEAHGISSVYEALALTVANSAEMLEFLAALPVERQQPNLFFAAIRKVAGTPHDGNAMEVAVRAHSNRIREVMLLRTTQTNEPARCAVLLPALAQLRQPLALIEVGASAGLCLLPDRYGYDYGRCQVDGPSSTSLPCPVFPCIASDGTPLPRVLPSVKWRCGLDLNPLDVACATDMAWLETLAWPGAAGKKAERSNCRRPSRPTKSLPRRPAFSST